MKRLLFIFCIIFYFSLSGVFASQNTNIAVINFYSDMSGSDNSWMAAGFSETLIGKLARLQNINVMQRENQMPILQEMGLNINQQLEPAVNQTLGKTLGVDYLISGVLNESNKKVTVKFQLFDVKNGTVIAEEVLNGSADNIFELQSELAMKVAKYVNSPLTEEVRQELYFIPTHNMASFEKFSTGLQLYEGNRIDEAYGFFLKSIQSDTSFLDAHRYFEYAARQTGKLDEFISNYENMLSSDPDNPILMNYLGNAYLDKKELSRAEGLYKKSISFSPSFGNPHNNLASIYVLSKRYDEALQEFEKALKYSDRRAPVYYNIGICYKYMNNEEKAKEYFAKALEVDPKNPNFILARYYIYGVKVLVTYRQKKVPGDVYGEVLLNSEPVFQIESASGGFTTLERAKIITGRLQTMISEGLKPYDVEVGRMNKEVVLKSSSGSLIITITRDVALREGTTPEKLAKHKLEILKNIMNSSTAVSYTLGGLITQGKDSGENVKDIEGVSEESSLIHKGDECYNQGNPDKASEYYRKALSINPSFAPANFCLGVVFYDRQNYDQAISCFNNAIKNSSDYTDAYVCLGKTYMKQGKRSDAKSCFLKAIEIEPNNSEAKNCMKGL